MTSIGRGVDLKYVFMRAWKFNVILAAFFILTFGVFYLSSILIIDGEGTHFAPGEAEEQVSRFKKIHYYLLSNGQQRFLLNADSMNVKNDDITTFSLPQGIYFERETNIPVYYQAKAGEYFKKQEVLDLFGDVDIKREKSLFKADMANYQGAIDELTGVGNTYTEYFDSKTQDILKIWSKKVKSWPKTEISHYFGDVKGRLIRARAYEQGAYFESEILKANMPISQIDLIDNVYIQRLNMKAWSRLGEIYLENYNKKLKYYLLIDDVRLEEKFVDDKGAPIVRKSFSERLDGYNAQKKVVLTGAPRVLQGEDVIKGTTITLRQNSGVVEVDNSSSTVIYRND